MKFPLEKYKFFQHERKDGSVEVIAVSTFAGRTVKGRAVCHPNDKFDMDTGKMIAALRCAEKIAEKRSKRAIDCYNCACDNYDEAVKFVSDMEAYMTDSADELASARAELKEYVDNVMGR